MLARPLGRFTAAILVPIMLLFTGQALAADGQSRTLDTAHGEIQVPADPQRVVTLYEAALDTTLAVGVEPLGAVATRGGTDVADYIADRAQGVAIVGGPREINLEEVLRQRPDLILASPFLADADYQRLSRIAPTVVPKHDAERPFGDDYWRKESELFADALGRHDRIEAVFEALDQRIERLRQQLSPEGDVRVTLMRWNPQGPIVMSDKVFAGDLLRRLGFVAPEIARTLTSRPHTDMLSLENLGRADGDWLLLATLNAEGRDALAAAQRQPAFQRLEAVRNGHVLTVDGQLWTSAAGPLAAERILDQVEEKMLGEPAADIAAQ
ncbi:ABC transporter substrate-binding protein [Halotalea alkalilenta]|uniref:ABC transporter substrate-binding protein n=1 Tax=Halotalea alkalilenta TaxID=376489 RepID=UPI0005BA6EFF|nr:iron-siderophore ABC transporter substrate-binding protein [Halotalea alkalilenta]